jgi:tRNA-dihydrouridine synthase
LAAIRADGRAAQIVEGMGADVIDINMGCPCRKSQSTTPVAA